MPSHRNKRIACIFVLFGLLPVIRADEKVVGGPYVVNVRQRTATVEWVVQTTEVSLGKEPGTSG